MCPNCAHNVQKLHMIYIECAQIVHKYMICTNCTSCTYNVHKSGPPLCKSGCKLSLSLLRSLSLSHILLSNRVRDSYVLCGRKLSLSLLRSLSLSHILLSNRVRDSYILCGRKLSLLSPEKSFSQLYIIVE